MTLNQILLVGIGGFLGSVTRFAVYFFLNPSQLLKYPLATVVVNALGCFAAGSLWARVNAQFTSDQPLVLFLSVGFFGAFTTFSALGIDTLVFVKQDEVARALIHVAMNLVLGIGAAFFGRWLFQ